MRYLNTGKLMDLLRKVNVSFIEHDGIEKDLEHPEKFEEVEEVKKHWSKKRIALVGSAGGALVSAGLAILAIKKHGKPAA